MTGIKNRTPVGTLSGSLDVSVGSQAGRNGDQGSLSGGGTVDVLVTSVVVTPTEASNVIILKWSVYRTNSSNIEIREGANVIATINGSSTGILTINTTIADVSVASHTYNCWVLAEGVQFFQIGDEWVTFGAAVNVDDTHASSAKKLNKIIEGS